jgi:hypothetical protein
MWAKPYGATRWYDISGTNQDASSRSISAAYAYAGSGTGYFTVSDEANPLYTPEFAGGNGSSGNPYQITTASNLNNVRNHLGSYFILNSNIDLSGTTYNDQSGDGWEPIGASATPFTGNFHGNGHTINNLFISKSAVDNIGLFGYTSSSSSIQELGIVSANIAGQNNVGALVGYASGTISKCYSTGLVSGASESSSNNIGGLVGTNAYSIAECYSRATVGGSNASNIGGLAGYNLTGCSILHCYAAGETSGSSNFSGLVIGAENSMVVNSFWDNEVGSDDDSGLGYGTGKTTLEMKTTSTFTDWGWDNTGTIWKIDAGINDGYPFLAWQNTIGGSALPVELTSFTGSILDNKVTLNWKTTTEVNNYGFNIERRIVEAVNPKSQNTTANWEKVGFVKGNGASSSVHNYSYTDANVSSGTYVYRLKQIDNDGIFKYSSEAEVTITIPNVFALNQNYPNPFNPSTVIGYSLPVTGSVCLKVYDIVGREVATLVNETKEAGSYQVTFNASKLASGVYFYKLQSSSYTSVKKLLMIK